MPWPLAGPGGLSAKWGQNLGAHFAGCPAALSAPAEGTQEVCLGLSPPSPPCGQQFQAGGGLRFAKSRPGVPCPSRASFLMQVEGLSPGAKQVSA